MRLIDAEQLAKDIMGFLDCENGYSDTYDKAQILSAIEEQPTIEERKNGKWLKSPYADERYWRECSVCGTLVRCYDPLTKWSGHGSERYDTGELVKITRNYCPICGAHMKGAKR